MAPSQIIVVMGVTGVGKSTFIRHATGLDVAVGDSQFSCTDRVDFYQIPDTNVHLMDTPGFDDTKKSDTEILKIISDNLVGVFKRNYEISGALYIHSLTEAKMRGSGRKNLIMFKNVLGTKGMKNCRLVTTKWGLQDESVSKRREQELCEKEEFWKPLLAAGAKTVPFGDNMQSAIEIIKPLIQGPAFKPLIVKEITDGKTLPRTAAGKIVNDDIAEAHKAHQAEIADLREQEKKALEKKDIDFAKLLREERREHEEKVKKLKEDKANLESATLKKRSGGFGRWFARGTALAVGGIASAVSGGALAPAALLLYGATEAGVRAREAYKA